MQHVTLIDSLRLIDMLAALVSRVRGSTVTPLRLFPASILGSTVEKNRSNRNLSLRSRRRYTQSGANQREFCFDAGRALRLRPNI